MFLKRLTLKGFRTYKNETTITFTRGINCIVGFNGSGKSTILLALEFILSDASDYRGLHMHEGVGISVENCEVEVVFDNTEKHMNMFQQDEIKVKKIVNGLKCELFINEESVTRTQYIEMLESCGVCINNLYNFIKQGQIIKLSNMREEEILSYLKNILGAKLFDEKKKEALSMLKECDLRKHAADKEFADMNEKLETLKMEFERFLMYQKLEEEKQHLEYFLNEINYKKIYEDTQRLRIKLQDIRNAVQEEDKKLNLTSNNKSELSEQVIKLKLEVLSFQNELDQIISEGIKNKRNIVHLQILVDEKKKEKEQKEIKNKAKLDNLNKINQFITIVTNKLNSMKIEIQNKEKEIEEKTQQINTLLSNKKSIKSTDEMFSENVKHIENIIDELDKELKAVQVEVAKQEELQETYNEKIRMLEKEHNQLDVVVEKYNKEINELTITYEESVEKKRQHQKEISEESMQMNVVKSQIIEANEKYDETIKSSNKEIIKIVELIFAESNIDKSQIIGFLIDNIHVESAYIKAVDTILDNHYFTLIVENMEIAKQIAEFIDQKKEETTKGNFNFKDFFYGKLTIVPLQNIRLYGEPTCPDDSNTIPLFNCIKCDPKIQNFLKNLLYKTILVKSIETCQNYMEEQYNCVNIDGDYLSKHGFMFGGNNRKKYGVYAIYNKLKDLKKEEKRIKEHIEELRKKIEEIDRENEIIADKKSTVLSQKNGCATNQKALHNYVKVNEENKRVINEKLKSLEEKRSNLEDHKASLKMQILQLRKSNVRIDKNSVNNNHGEHVTGNINLITEEINKIKEELVAMRNEYDDFKSKLDLLYQKRSETDTNIYMEEYEDFDMDEHVQELKEQQDLIEKIENEKQNIEKKIEQTHIEINNIKANIEKLIINENKQKKNVMDLCHQINLINEELAVLDMKEDIIRKKKMLLPQGAEEKVQYKHFTKSQLSSKLKAVTLELKNYANVNEKAGDQLKHFLEGFDEIKRRNEDVKLSYKNIKSMIHQIDEKKDQALEATFIKINAYFTEYFSLLFKNKRAQLVLQRLCEKSYKDKLRLAKEKARRRGIDEEAVSVDRITGISVRIQSLDQDKTIHTFRELSGGERSIVAICLFLCLNKIDNFSFFFFDEIDAALDTVHRDNLALLIKELSGRGTQFIITTFRKELLEYCDNLYTIRLVDRESQIRKGTKDEAYTIISIEEKNALAH